MRDSRVLNAGRLAPGKTAGCRFLPRQTGFSLVELLVVITIVLVLMGLTGAALSNARSNQKQQGTRALIGKLAAIVDVQFQSYASRKVTASTPEARAAELRLMATGDLPDRWEDVSFMAGNPARFKSRHQQIYIAIWNSMITKPSATHAGAECLFMIVMRGGIADCLDCSDLAGGKIGDKDNDSAFEFWDEWGNPIGFILWPGGLRLPADSETTFFGNTPPFMPSAAGRPLRPLVYSPGPDGEYGLERNGEVGNLVGGSNCGNPSIPPTSTAAAPLSGAADNITNLDQEKNR